MATTNRYSPEAMAAERAAQAARRAETFAGISALGFADDVAHLAANSLLTFGNAPGYGLNDFDDLLKASQARRAIEAYRAALTGFALKMAAE